MIAVALIRKWVTTVRIQSEVSTALASRRKFCKHRDASIALHGMDG